MPQPDQHRQYGFTKTPTQQNHGSFASHLRMDQTSLVLVLLSYAKRDFVHCTTVSAKNVGASLHLLQRRTYQLAPFPHGVAAPARCIFPILSLHWWWCLYPPDSQGKSVVRVLPGDDSSHSAELNPSLTFTGRFLLLTLRVSMLRVNLFKPKHKCAGGVVILLHLTPLVFLWQTSHVTRFSASSISADFRQSCRSSLPFSCKDFFQHGLVGSSKFVKHKPHRLCDVLLLTRPIVSRECQISVCLCLVRAIFANCFLRSSTTVFPPDGGLGPTGPVAGSPIADKWSAMGGALGTAVENTEGQPPWNFERQKRNCFVFEPWVQAAP